VVRTPRARSNVHLGTGATLTRLLIAALCLSASLQAGRILLAPARGLQAEYFVGQDTGGQPAISTIDSRVSTRHMRERWSGAAPSIFSARWFGFLTVPAGGRYSFATTSDDASVLSVDGRVLVDNGGRHGPQTMRADVELAAGVHPVLVEFTQMGGEFTLEWEWARAGDRLEAVPSWARTTVRVAPWRVIAARTADLASILLLGVGVALAGWRIRTIRWRPIDHPRAATLALFALLAIVHTWPLASDPAGLTRHDNRDMMLNEWIVAWVAHQVPTAPLDLFDANIFHPEQRTLAYSETMLVQSAMGAPLLWLGASPVLTYNLLLLAGLTLSGWAMCLVVRGWTGDWAAGLVSGIVFAFSAHVLTRIPHLQTQHVEFLPLALAALDRLLRRPGLRGAIALGVWCVLQSLTSIYLLAITIFSVAAAIGARAGEWTGERLVPVAKALGVAAAMAAVLLAPFLLPYYRVSADLGLTRSLADAANYSAVWTDYLTTPSRLHRAIWSGAITGGTGLFPGALGLVLTLVAIVRGVAFRDPRARMCLAIGVVGVYLSFGPRMPGYAALYAIVPVLHGVRATARFGYMATLAVAAVAGFGVASLRTLVPARAWAWASVLLVAVAATEPLAAPLGLTPFDGIPALYDRPAREPGVVVELPFPGPSSAQFHAHYMLNSTRHWQPLVNGYSGFQPPSYYEHAAILQGFPDAASIGMLGRMGVRHVFVHRSQLGQPQLDALKHVRELERVDGFGDVELYRLR
jgi:hypothetical protein